jgi:hypothetical protein
VWVCFYLWLAAYMHTKKNHAKQKKKKKKINLLPPLSRRGEEDARGWMRRERRRHSCIDAVEGCSRPRRPTWRSTNDAALATAHWKNTPKRWTDR